MENPTQIGKYEILSVLGRGGMGVVYRALDAKIGRQVAIKTVTEVLLHDTVMLQRFSREAEKMGMLKHPNIITLYYLGEQDGYPYIVMEYVEGDPLDKLIERGGRLSLTYKLRIMEQVCLALGYAHSHDVVHRDVKPANVIVRPDGIAKLLDFGIAREEKDGTDITVTQAGSVIGTVPYMAPERLRGQPLDGRSDIFAAGVVLYQLLTGVLPFTGAELVLVNQLLNDQHRPLSDYLEDYPPALEDIITRSLEKNPDVRYQAAEEMASDLHEVIESLKGAYAAEVIAQAEQLVAKRELIAARDVLTQLLRVDSQHAPARRFLAEVTAQLSMQVRAEQAQQKRLKAEEEFNERRYDNAIQLLQDAQKLVPDDRSFAERLTEVRESKEKNDRIVGYLRQADAARQDGDFAAAQAIVEKAMKLDTNNSRLRAAYLALVRQAEEAALKAKVKGLVDAARKELSERNFPAALELIKQAEETAPADTDVRDLRDAVQQGIAQEERRKVLEEIDSLMAAAMTREDVERIVVVLHRALENAPSDPTLLRYQAQVDAEIRKFERNAMVDAAVKESLGLLDAKPMQALGVVGAALLLSPGDERLVGLEGRIRDRIARQSAQEKRDGILLQAREALTARKFADAVAVLEQCRGPLWTTEVAELLEFAREQAEREQREVAVAACYTEALTLQREGRDDALVHLVRPVVERTGDANLRKMLEDAEQRIEERRAETEAALNAVAELVEEGCHEQVIAFVEGLPERVAAVAQIQELVAASKRIWEEEWTLLQRLGACYAGLSVTSPLADGDLAEKLKWDVDVSRASKALAELSRTFESRRMALIDTALEGELTAPAGVAVDPRLLGFASDAVRERWVAATQQGAGKFLSKLGRRK